MSIPPEPPPIISRPTPTPQQGPLLKPVIIGSVQIPFWSIVRATAYAWLTWTTLSFVYDEVMGRLALHRLETEFRKTFRSR